MRWLRVMVAGASLVALVGCGSLPDGIEEALAGPTAPAVCGFEPGTALEYAGRSTTGDLGVEEVPGDPMADEPADIYITAEAFSQGERSGRLVCALYDDPAFVEITIHPADGGRVHPVPAAPPQVPPATELTEADAVRFARAELDEPDEWVVQVVESGPLDGMASGSYLDQPWAIGVPSDRWVWRIHFVRDDDGIDVVVDYRTGAVLGTQAYRVN